MHYLVYKIVYTPTNKVCYIGSTRQTLKERYRGHCKDRRRPMYDVINSRGRDNFDIVAIDAAQTQQDAFEKEKFWTEFWRMRTFLYNIDTGKARADIVKRKLSTIGHTKTGTKNNFYGHKHSEQAKMKMRLAKQGKRGNRRKPVICLTTGKVYSSLLDAARSINKTPSAIGSCCRAINKHCAGMEWSYL